MGRADVIESIYKWVEEQSRILRLQSDTYNDEECFGGWRAMEDTRRYLEKQLKGE